MATVTREDLDKLIDEIEASVEELTGFGDQGAEASRILADAAAKIRTALDENKEDEAAGVVSELRAKIMGFQLLFDAYSGGDRGYERKSDEKPQQSLRKTAQAVRTFNRIATDIGRHLQGRQ